MIWLLVTVHRGAEVVFQPEWVGAQEHLKLANLLDQICKADKYLESHNVTVKVAKDEHSPTHSATLSQPLMTFYSYGDRFVKFKVTPNVEEEKEQEPEEQKELEQEEQEEEQEEQKEEEKKDEEEKEEEEEEETEITPTSRVSVFIIFILTVHDPRHIIKEYQKISSQ